LNGAVLPAPTTTNLEARDAIETWKLFYIPIPHIEACPVPRASYTPLSQVALDQGGPIMGALVAYCRELSFLTYQKNLGVSQLYFLHSIVSGNTIYQQTNFYSTSIDPIYPIVILPYFAVVQKYEKIPLKIFCG